MAACPSSARVIQWASTLTSSDGELRLFHVSPAVRRAGEEDPAARLEALERLVRALPARRRVSLATTAGDLVEQVLAHARLMDADLIVVGMHGSDGDVSPVARAIAAEARCAVLAVDARAQQRFAWTDASTALHLLCAVTLTPASMAAIDYAHALSRRTAGRLTLAHIFEERWIGPHREDANVRETRTLLERHLRELLEITVLDAAAPAAHDTEVFLTGQPGVEIVRLAHHGNADVIVMGLDRVELDARQFGTTTACVMQFANRPVLLVPPAALRYRLMSE